MKISDFKFINNNMRFHTPGHSGTDIGITSYDDITELSYSDNLINPTGAIADAESGLANIYGANRALIFTGGATSAINAVLLALKQKFDNPVIKLTGETHKSTEQYIAVHDLKKKEAKDGFNILFHTSPDYYGRFENAERGDFLTVLDASHASHYVFNGRFPAISAEDYDIIIYSLHKTLPVLTGGAAVVTNDEDLYLRLCCARAMTHTTSPSYMIIKSIDRALDILSATAEKDYENVYASVTEFISECSYKAYYHDDFTRLTIDLEGRDGKALSEYLEANGVYVEMTRGDKLVLIVTPYNSSFLKPLNKLLHNSPVPDKLTAGAPIPKAAACGNSHGVGVIDIIAPVKSIGRISACEIGVYPPGTAIITRGQIITTEIIDFINQNTACVFGLIDGKIPVIRKSR